MFFFKKAFLSNYSVSSCSWKLPVARTWRSRTGSMAFVRASATCEEVGIHRKVFATPFPYQKHFQCRPKFLTCWHGGPTDQITKALAVGYDDGFWKTLKSHLSFFPVKLGNIGCSPQQSHSTQTIYGVRHCEGLCRQGRSNNTGSLL